MQRVKYVQDIRRVEQLSSTEREALREVTEKHRFRANNYYLSLIDWNDPADPIRRIIIPCIDELEDWGDLDASDEETNYAAHGLQHKYQEV